MSDVYLLISENNLTITDSTAPLSVVIYDVPISGGAAETPLTIKTKYESNADTNALTDALLTKLTDDYTAAEIDTLLGEVVSNIDWKEAVATFGDLATTYPTPDEGWTASVDDEDAVYRYDGSAWVLLANGVVPLATAVLDGKLSKEDFTKLQLLQPSQGSQYDFNFADGSNGWTASTTIKTNASGDLVIDDESQLALPCKIYTNTTRKLRLEAGDSGTRNIVLFGNTIEFSNPTAGGEHLYLKYITDAVNFEARLDNGFEFMSDIVDTSTKTAGFIINNQNVTTKDTASFQSAGVEVAKINTSGDIHSPNFTITGGEVKNASIEMEGVSLVISASGWNTLPTRPIVLRTDNIKFQNNASVIYGEINPSASGFDIQSNFNGIRLRSEIIDAYTETAGTVVDNILATTKDIMSWRAEGVEKASIDINGKIFNGGLWFGGTLGGTATADTFFYMSSSQKITSQADNGYQFNIGASRWIDISQRGVAAALRLGVTGQYTGKIQAGDHAGLVYGARIDDANNLIAHSFVNDVPVPAGSDFMKWTNDTQGANTDFLVMDENGDTTLSGDLITNGNLSAQGTYLYVGVNAFRPAGAQLRVYTGSTAAGSHRANFNQDSMYVGLDYAFNFGSSNEAIGSPDVGIKRDSAGVLKVTDGSTGNGQLLYNKPLINIAATHTAIATNHVINCTSNTFTVTLPTAVGIEGKEYIIKNSGVGTITVDADGTETIDGALTASLNQYDSITAVSDGTNWIII